MVQGPIIQRFVSQLLHGAAAINLGAVAAFLYRRALRGTDYGWANLDRHASEWDERTGMIADLIPAPSWVVEFGCGRRVLETLLPDDCVYIPSDIVSRGPDTWVCDLNRRPLPKVPPHVGIAVFSGVLEYVIDLPAVLRWLSGANVTTIVASYSCVRPAGLSRVFDTIDRLRFSWVTSYSERELLAAFGATGYELDRRGYWRNQFVGRFVKRGSWNSGGTARSTMTEPTRDTDAVARILLSDAMCVTCIMDKTGLELDPVLDAITTLEVHFRLVRRWGRCHVCSMDNRRVLLKLS